MLTGWPRTMDKPFRFFLILLLNWSAFSLEAQWIDSTFHRLEPAVKDQTESIYLRFSTYIKDDKAYPIGIMGGGIKQEFVISPDAMGAFKAYQKQKKWSLICTGIQLVTQIAAFTTKDKSLRKGLLIGAGAVSVINVPLYIGSNNNLSKAVWIRNKEVLNHPQHDMKKATAIDR